MKNLKARHHLIIVMLIILFIIFSIILSSPFMFSNGTLITRKAVKEFDLSYTLGDARNCSPDYGYIYLFDFNPKTELPVIHERIHKDATSGASRVKSDFKKIGPGIWRLNNSEQLGVRIFEYQRGSKKYYFIYKSL